VGAAPQARSCFSGGTGRGEPEPKGATAKQKLRRRRAPQKPRSSAETNGRTGDATERNTMLRVAAVVGTAQSKPSPIGEHRTGSRRRRSRSGSDKCVVRKLGRPGILSKHTRRRDASASETQLRSHWANRITDESTAKSVPKSRGNVSVTNCSVHPELSDFRY
jgi:hypothetical protein